VIARRLATLGATALAALGAIVAVSACTQAASPDAPAIATVHRHECGRCHAPPAPQSHTRGQLQDAFARHRDRVRLSDDEWSAILVYLAARDGAADSRGN
jgi:hypothetical protein